MMNIYNHKFIGVSNKELSNGEYDNYFKKLIIKEIKDINYNDIILYST